MSDPGAQVLRQTEKIQDVGVAGRVAAGFDGSRQTGERPPWG